MQRGDLYNRVGTGLFRHIRYLLGAVGQDINSEISDIEQLSDFRVRVRSLMCESAGLTSRLFTLKNQTNAMS